MTSSAEHDRTPGGMIGVGDRAAVIEIHGTVASRTGIVFGPPIGDGVTTEVAVDAEVCDEEERPNVHPTSRISSAPLTSDRLDIWDSSRPWVPSSGAYSGDDPWRIPAWPVTETWEPTVHPSGLGSRISQPSSRTWAGVFGLTFGVLLALRGEFWIPVGLAAVAFGCYLIVTSYQDRDDQD